MWWSAFPGGGAHGCLLLAKAQGPVGRGGVHGRIDWFMCHVSSAVFIGIVLCQTLSETQHGSCHGGAQRCGGGSTQEG